MVRRRSADRPARRASARPPTGTTLDDQSLTEAGLAAPTRKSGRILLIACGALAREILQLKKQGGWDHMDLTCLPAILHNHPDQITASVEALIGRNSAIYDKIYVVYADCGTGGQLQQACDRLGVEMVQGPHCYSFYEGNDRFAQHLDDETTAFYLTDFLARQFDSFIWKPLGLDRHPELREMYFGNYTKLVYQAQTDNPELTARAQGYANRLGLEFERRVTGFGDLQTTLAAWADRS
ncbi:DUF1638 domain-containing protein [Sedimentitalea nanhaiensis]|uniref:DUF1638 domain-containing protein n=1 Tax=Sedimentitalea nanhaiensis TaxID=999627 RepID=A0A1I6ZI01_9RHOB|nr:DUF1638 domain-containing protein [Sedimentitalea nanhaiensis]SFT62310.1 Protein of unknown function [Sedimentitalea nanhaiensis]